MKIPVTVAAAATTLVYYYCSSTGGLVVEAFATTRSIATKTSTKPSLSSTARSGWLDFGKFTASGSGSSKEDLDEQWEAQQEILRNRRKPQAERDVYFKQIEERRQQASVKQKNMWAWQTKTYAKGEDPINEWKKRRADGSISDLDNQYGDPKQVGGIPLPMPSFGVGGEFGVGGKYDNGGRFDLRLPYADQGYVDDDADVMAKLGNLWSGRSGGGSPGSGSNSGTGSTQPTPKKGPPPPPAAAAPDVKKKGGWPW